MEITKVINFNLEKNEIDSLIKATNVLAKIQDVMDDAGSEKIFLDGRLDSTYEEIENTIKTIRKFICDEEFEVIPTEQEEED